MKQIIRTIKWIVVLAVVVAGAVLIFLAIKIGQPVSSTASENVFVVPAGATTKQVASSLDSQGLISRAWYFEAYVYFKGQGGKIQAGKYSLSGSMSIREIVALMTSGEAISDDLRFTVIEGWTTADIGEALQKAGLGTKSEFVKKNSKNEGYLFPDTYFLDSGWTAEQIAEKMMANFKKRVGEVSRDKVILASIVEREVGRPAKAGTKLSADEVRKISEERRVVAGIFYNRLEIGMGLESDATISYITGKRMASALLEDLKIDSPYNTYKYHGLPPGPIGSPGADAIESALHPTETDFLYFLTDAEGEAHYAKTLAGHNQNREKYLQ